MFFELGLGFVISQNVSHEAGLLAGPAARGRGSAAAAWRPCSAWRPAGTPPSPPCSCIAVMPGGFWFFGRVNAESPPCDWQAAWALTVVATAAGSLLVPVILVANGCGRMALTAKVTVVQTVVGTA